MEELNDYELARARLIARNRERMVAMGLLGAANSLTAKQEASKSTAAAKKPRPRPRKSHRAPQAPTRVSKRLRGEKTDGGSGVKEEEEEEEERQPTPSPPRWTEEQLLELRRDEELRMSERLSDLELSGLIDASPGVAHFAIVGAHHKGQKRKHYKVTLENLKNSTASASTSTSSNTSTASCECPDYRIRRKRYGGHCKHIKLVLVQLGLGGEGETTSDGWEEALERVVMAKT